MYMPNGYLGFQDALFRLGGENDFYPTAERLCRALASEELVSFGIVIGTVDATAAAADMGEILPVRSGTWRQPRTQGAVLAGGPHVHLHQDGLVLVAIFQEGSLVRWHEAVQEYRPPGATLVQGGGEAPPAYSFGARALPSGYVSFHELPKVALAWAESGIIDRDRLLLLEPPETDPITAALAAGVLIAFGVNYRTGEIMPLPASTWRAGAERSQQSIWVLQDSADFVGTDGEPCLPVLTEADFARILQATNIPLDPPELPEAWKPAVAIESIQAASPPPEILAAWMRGYAEGFKVHNSKLKREIAISAAQASRKCTYRAAAAAFSTLPFPELRDPPRTSGA